MTYLFIIYFILCYFSIYFFFILRNIRNIISIAFIKDTIYSISIVISCMMLCMLLLAILTLCAINISNRKVLKQTLGYFGEYYGILHELTTALIIAKLTKNIFIAIAMALFLSVILVRLKYIFDYIEENHLKKLLILKQYKQTIPLRIYKSIIMSIIKNSLLDIVSETDYVMYVVLLYMNIISHTNKSIIIEEAIYNSNIFDQHLIAYTASECLVYIFISIMVAPLISKN